MVSCLPIKHVKPKHPLLVSFVSLVSVVIVWCHFTEAVWIATDLDLKRQKPFISIYYYFFSHHLELMATHSSVLAWKIPGTGEPDGLPSMGSYRVGHDWSDLAVAELVLGFPYGSAGKESTCNAGDLGLIPGLEWSPGKGTATNSSIPAWRIPQTTVRSKRVGHNWATSLSLHRACLPSSSNISSAIPCVWDSRCLEHTIQISNQFL